MDCFEKVIGLTNKDCECFPDKPAGAEESDSDLVLDELEGLPLDFATAAAECGEEDGLWSKMVLARKTAIKQTQVDLLACIAKNNILDLKTWTGFIGEQGFKKQLSISSQWVGLRFTGEDKKGTHITINSIALMISESGTFNVKVFNNRSEAALANYDVVTVANRLSTKKIDAPLRLPLFDDGYGSLVYYIVYEPGTAQPKDSKVSCGCGNKESEIKNYLSANGIIGDNISDFDARLANPTSFRGTSDYSYGLSLSVSLDCDQAAVLCRNYEQDINFRQYFAQAVLYKSGENLLTFILNTGEISRYTQTDKEGLYGRRNHFRKEYVDHVSYLCGTIDLSKTACFKCRQNMKIGKLIS